MYHAIGSSGGRRMVRMTHAIAYDFPHVHRLFLEYIESIIPIIATT
jgi:hypothetical protein